MERLPNGNIVEVQYNGYDDIVYAKDAQTEVSYTYSPLGNITSRKQNGKVVKFKYDIDEQLVSVINEKGETYEFERDVKGNIKKEIGFDKIMKIYEKISQGWSKGSIGPGGRFTAYEYDKSKNVIRVDYFDKTWDNFSYNKKGELIKAVNGDVSIVFERNPAGQVTKEWQDDQWVASEYNEMGERLQISSSLGAKIAVARDQMGQISHMAAAQNGRSAWKAKMAYNELGQEIERIIPGNVVSKWQYDITGRATNHQVNSGNRDTRRCQYNWGINDRLKSIKNELSGHKIAYSYDECNNLVSSQEANFEFLYRVVDDVGNIYETKDKSDRVYGEGSRLLQSSVDTKELRNEFQGGFGKQITQGKRFEYDSLGRRIEKRSDSNIIKFVWDGDIILHEWKAVEESEPNANENLVTWVFQDGFVPTAKITKEGNYSIVSDHLGTPVEAYDDEGDQVWSAELDAYGRVKKYVGEKGFIPFRYQGQYADAETELYYNRFRYYSPVDGQYTQQDPIGLAGGNSTVYSYVIDTNTWIDPLGLNVKTGANRTHVTYQGIKNGLPYTGYASAPSSQNLTPTEIVSRRYGGNFKDFGGNAPDPVYSGEGVAGKQAARGLEQHYYETDIKAAKGNKAKVANKQNPVGENNANKNNYKKAADKHLKKQKNKLVCPS